MEQVRTRQHVSPPFLLGGPATGSLGIMANRLLTVLRRTLTVLRRTLEPLPILGDSAWVIGVLIIALGAGPLGASVTAAGADYVPSTAWGSYLLLAIVAVLLLIAAYRTQEELDQHAADTPRLVFDEPEASEETIYSRTALVPWDQVGPVVREEQKMPVLLWRIALKNVVDGTKACNVRVLLAESTPPLQVLPIDLHEKHDDTSPWRQFRDIRHGEPVIFDVVGKAEPDELFFWRSDLSATYVYQVSHTERQIIDEELKTSGITITLRAIADPPVKVAEQEYRLVIDGTGQLNVTQA